MKRYDLAVIGGGFAGVAAALARSVSCFTISIRNAAIRPCAVWHRYASRCSQDFASKRIGFVKEKNEKDGYEARWNHTIFLSNATYRCQKTVF